jgi:hypothetical protein
VKYLRVTAWVQGRPDPVTTVIPEDSLREPIYRAATNHRAVLAMGGGGVTDYEVEIHDLDAKSEVEAMVTILAERQERLPDERRHLLTAFDWVMDTLLKLNPGGIAQTTAPSPLPAPVLGEMLARVAVQPEYRGQTVNMFAEDWTAVSLVAGKVVMG